MMRKFIGFLVVLVAVFSGWSSGASAGIIHHYTFTNGVTDLVGGTNGVLQGGASVIGGELLLDGTDDYVQLAGAIIPTSGSYSVSLFARQPTPQSDFREMISQGGGFYIGHTFDGNIRVGDSWLFTQVPFPSDGERHHFAVTVDSGESRSRLYVDGVLRETTFLALGAGTDNTRFGAQYGTHGEYFGGALDEIRIYDHVLSTAEIAAIPEPSTALLLGIGLSTLAATSGRRSQS